ncbi:uncharacterized protein MYCFIDRAFT_193530 [Pseudocercospora fijiensis CIRAD86]|uniref:Uncharacterized protein n=1 Tax=Pseudocercospora fijiensis (strain CIRAD86) TaxID=383855 RepID=N1QD31_PSEFD|nr:uncharacterized protein MYCFIDRAFT_193530 [Pseudocercospora fijiensis CIRAD86]EME89673.1 hypothetical protein MYCFIDRAFT_193530 [Pseudocercospora fijiensis CIRAD86]
MDWSSTAAHHIIDNPSTHEDHLEIHRKGRIVLLADRSTNFFGKSELRLRTSKIDGDRTVAAAKLKPTYHGCRVLLGDPDDRKARKAWQETETSGTYFSRYQILWMGRKFYWKRLHLDSDPGVPHEQARIDYMQDLGQDLEHLVLVSAMALIMNQALLRKARGMPLAQGPFPLTGGFVTMPYASSSY